MISYVDPLGNTFVMPCAYERIVDPNEEREEEVKDDHHLDKWHPDYFNPYRTHSHRYLDMMDHIKQPEFSIIKTE